MWYLKIGKEQNNAIQAICSPPQQNVEKRVNFAVISKNIMQFYEIETLKVLILR